MSRSVNKVFLLGRVGKVPEIKRFENGGAIASFSLATGRKWEDKGGNEKEDVQWHMISVKSEPLVNIVERYIGKGDQLHIEGSLETRKWQDKSGQDRWTTEVVLRPYSGEIVMLGSPGGKSNKGSGSQDGGNPSTDEANDLDDEIPF